MKRRLVKTIGFLSLIGAACLAAPSAVNVAAQQAPQKFFVPVDGWATSLWNDQEAILTFNVPVQVPKVTLPPGTYVFTQIAPWLVRVTDLTRIPNIAIFSTLPTMRKGKGAELHEWVRFQQVVAGEPVRIIGMYQAGAVTGYQPLYPKAPRGQLPATTIAER